MITITPRTAALAGFPYTIRQTRSALQAMLDVLGLTEVSLELILTDDGEIARLNEEFLGCVGPTNILSFPTDDSDLHCENDVEVQIATCEKGAHLNQQENRIQSICRGDGKLFTEPATDIGVLALSTISVAREAFLYGQQPEEHALRLLAHGLLHLAGYDHGPEMDELTDTLVEHALTMQPEQTKQHITTI